MEALKACMNQMRRYEQKDVETLPDFNTKRQSENL